MEKLALRFIRPSLLRTTLALALAAPVALANPRPSSAQGGGQANTVEAKERFKRALQLYQDGSLDAALVEFQRAHELSPNWKILYNIAMIHRDQRDYVSSLAMLERFLAEGGRAIDAAKRKTVETEINTLKGYVATIAVIANADGAEISIDDKPRGTTPLAQPVLVNAGTRKVSAKKEGFEATWRSVTVAGGDATQIRLDMREIDNKPAAPPPPPAPPPRESPSRMTTWTWIGLGSAAALGVGAGITGAMALGKSSELGETKFVGKTPNAAFHETGDSAKALALTSDILAGTAIATAAVTIVWTLVRDPKPKTSGTLSPNGLGVKGSFQ